MSTHYNAFISYRHHPDDIRVAEMIHRSLERFRVPGKIRAKYGKITRLFRDKEELPITSDLNDDIDEALKNSDYLIVICSVHTRESIWVQREIELFLKSHHRSRVLTVLASGEPYDVIPEILLHDEVTDPVTGEKRRIDIEPLSCDWRGKRRKVMQEELPRLAAPLLGCSYDELRQRQKQYRKRRNTAIISSALAASFCLTAYFLYTSITIQRANVQIQKQNEEIQAANVQIQENLEEALINQSRHLATAARERLAEGDRLSAISLAAAALPGEGNVRPYVPEAERVLADALGVYTTADEMEAVGTVSPGANHAVSRFCVSDNEKTLYLYDDRKRITVWDTKSLQKLGEITLTDYMEEMLPLNNGNLVVHNGLGVYTAACFQPDGNLLWKMDGCRDVTYCPELDRLLVIRQWEGRYELICVNCANGERVGQALDLTLEDPVPEASAFVAVPNADVALIRYYQGIGSDTPFYAVDLHTGEKRQVDPAVYPAVSVITEDGTFVCMGEEEGLGISAIVEGNRVTTPGTRRICAYDLRTGKLLWENAITSPVGALTATIRPIPGGNRLLCVCGNLFMVLDAGTGQILGQCGAGSVVYAVDPGENYAIAVLQDGYLCRYHYDSNYCYEIKCMKNGVSAAAVGENCYSLHWQEDHVTVYRTLRNDPVWEATLEGGFSVNRQVRQGRYLAFQDSGRQYLFDTEAKVFLWAMEKGQKELLGICADGSRLWYADGMTGIVEADTATGKCRTLALEMEEGESISLERSFGFYEECLYYTLKSDAGVRLVRWNLATGEKTSCGLQTETEEEFSAWTWTVLQASGQYVWLHASGGGVLEADLMTGSVRPILWETERCPVIAVHPQGSTVALGDQGTVYLKTPGQDALSTITLDQANAGSMRFVDDTLLVLCDNGRLCRFDLSGTLLNQTQLQVSSQFASELSYSGRDLTRLSWQFTDGNDLIVNAMGLGNVIDWETWSVRATVSDFLYYDEEGNCMVCRRGNAIAGYPLHDAGALLELAEEALKGYEMTPEQRHSYGID